MSFAIDIINKISKNVVISAQYRQSVGDFKHKASLDFFFNKMNNSNKTICIVGDANIKLIDYKTNIKVKNYLNQLFRKNVTLVKNKPKRVSRNNVTIIDHISTSYFLNNDIHSGITTANSL